MKPGRSSDAVRRRRVGWPRGAVRRAATAVAACAAVGLSLFPAAASAAATGLPACTGAASIKALALVTSSHLGWDYRGLKRLAPAAPLPAALQTVWTLPGQPPSSSEGTITIYRFASAHEVDTDLAREAFLKRLAGNLRVVPHAAALSRAFPIAGATVFEASSKTSTSIEVVWPFERYAVDAQWTVSSNNPLTNTFASLAIAFNLEALALAVQSAELATCAASSGHGA